MMVIRLIAPGMFVSCEMRPPALAGVGDKRNPAFAPQKRPGYRLRGPKTLLSTNARSLFLFRKRKKRPSREAGALSRMVGDVRGSVVLGGPLALGFAADRIIGRRIEYAGK